MNPSFEQLASKTLRSFSDNVLRMTLMLFPAMVGLGAGFVFGASSRVRRNDFPVVVVRFISDMSFLKRCRDVKALSSLHCRTQA